MGLHSFCEQIRHFERGVGSDFLQAYSLGGRTWAGRQNSVLLCPRGSSTTGLEAGAHAGLARPRLRCYASSKVFHQCHMNR